MMQTSLVGQSVSEQQSEQNPPQHEELTHWVVARHALPGSTVAVRLGIFFGDTVLVS